MDVTIQAVIKENVNHIVNQLQLMSCAAQDNRIDVVLGTIAFIEVMLTEIKATL